MAAPGPGDNLVKAGCFLAGLVLVGSLAFVVPGATRSAALQPMPFNHAKHVAAGWKCANCHPYADSLAIAGLPRAQDCVDCHDQEIPKYPKNDTMRERNEELHKLVAEGKEVPWVQVHWTAWHANFSHRRHVEIAKLDCKLCHGDVEAMTAPFTKPWFPAGDREKMLWCLACHEERKASTDCLSCHR